MARGNRQCEDVRHGPGADPAAVLGRIGYLSEEPDLPGWMRVAELLRYTRAFYPRWDTTYADHLLRSVRVWILDARVKTLSKGQRARFGLIAAEAHRPDLLILDEPSSGLIQSCGATFSKRSSGRSPTKAGRSSSPRTCLDEVERVSDHLAMLHRGTLGSARRSTTSRRGIAGSRA